MIRISGGRPDGAGGAIFEDSSIIHLDPPTHVRRQDERISVEADLMGFNKAYYLTDGQTLRLSDRLSDFFDRPIDDELWGLQCRRGSLPYPFTPLKGVRRVLPGSLTTFRRADAGGWSVRADLSGLRRFVVKQRTPRIEDFRRDFCALIDRFKSAVPEKMILSFSGGFDSLLLGHLLKDRISAIVHYADDLEESQRLRRELGPLLPDVPWYLHDGAAPAPKEDQDAYFDSSQEAGCDATGLAMFLALKGYERHGGTLRGTVLIDGQNSDTVFLNDAKYFKELVMQRLFSGWRGGFSPAGYLRPTGPWSKLVCYLKSARTRFFDDYTFMEKLSEPYAGEILDAYEAYERALRGMPRPEFLSTVYILLFASVPRVERFKGLTHGLGHRYLLPFYNEAMLRLGLSIPAAYKTSRTGVGKKILREAFPRIAGAPVLAGALKRKALYANTLGTQGGHFKDLSAYYARRWRASHARAAGRPEGARA